MRISWLLALVVLVVALVVVPACSVDEKPEQGEGTEEHGEESGRRLGKNETWDETRNGARLILAYDPAAHCFRGTVENTTAEPLSQVRVEVHLSNGMELGPTARADLQPGQKIQVVLSTSGHDFAWWTTHPEHGAEREHGGERDGEHREGRGEHDGRRGEHGERRGEHDD